MLTAEQTRKKKKHRAKERKIFTYKVIVSGTQHHFYATGCSQGLVCCCYCFFEREILNSEPYRCNISKLSQVGVVIIRLHSSGRMLKA